MVDGTIKIDTKIDEKGADKGLKSLESSLSSFASIAAGIMAGLAVGDFFKDALKSQGDMELATASMETLLGSAQHAQQMMQDIVAMADKTPYESTGLTQAATTLLGFGVAAKDVMTDLTALGNAAKGNSEKMQSIAVVFGQIKANGKMVGNDFLQFINAGVPIVEVLSKGLGKSRAEIMAMRDAGKITFKEIDTAFKKVYTGTGEWANLMEKAAQSLPGMWSTLQDAMSGFGRTIVQNIEPVLKSLMKLATAFFNAFKKGETVAEGTTVSFIETLTSVIDSITGWVEKNTDLVTAIGEFGGVLIAATAALGGAAAAMWVFNAACASNPIGAVVAGIVAFIGVTVIAVKHFDSFGAALLMILGPLGMIVEQIKVMYDHWQTITDAFSSKGILQGLKEIGKALVDMMILPIQQMLEYLTWIPKFGAKAKAAAEGLKNFRENFLSAKKVTGEKQTIKPRLEYKPEIEGVDALSDEEKKALTDRKNRMNEYWTWLLEHNMSSTDAELTELARKYNEELTLAQGSAAEITLVNAKYEQQRQDIIAKSTKWETGYYFLRGVGMSEELAKGLASGLYDITHTVKHIGMQIARAFSTVVGFVHDAFSTAFDFLSWMSDFSPSDIYDSLKKFIEGLNDFFTKDIGSLPIFFDMAATLVENFIAGLIENLPSIVDSIGNMIDHIVNYIIDNGPELIEQIMTILNAIADKLIEKIPEIIDAVMTIVNAVIEQAPTIVDKLLKAIVAALEGFGDNAEKFAATLTESIAGVLESIADNISPLLVAVVKIIVALIKGIISKIPTLTSSFDKLMLALVQALTDAFPVLLKGIIAAIPALITAIVESVTNSLDEHTGEKMIIAVVKGLIKSMPGVIKQLVISIGKIFTQSIPALFKGLYNVGKNVILGFIKGVTDYGPKLWDGVKGVFTSFIDKVKNFFGIHSPSTVFYDFGVNLIQGLIDGIKAIAGKLFEAVKLAFAPVTEVFTALTDIIKTVFDAIMKIAQMDLSPIRVITTVFEVIKSVCSALVDVIKAVFDNIDKVARMDLSPVRVIGTVFDQIKDAAQGVIDTVMKLIDKIKELSGLGGGGGLSGLGDTGLGGGGGLSGLGDTISGIGHSIGGIGHSIGGTISGTGHSIGHALHHHLHRGFASGTNDAPGGLSLVGENGPELVELPAHSRVYTAAETKKMLSGAGYASIVNGLSSGRALAATAPASLTHGQSITLNNIMTGSVNIDGREIGRIAFRQIDKNVRLAYGN